MKKAIFPGMFLILICSLFEYSPSYGSSIIKTKILFNQDNMPFLFQDTTVKKSPATRQGEKDRTKGEAGQGQGRGTDTSRKATGDVRQRNDSDINKTSQDKNSQNSDNRGDGSNKNNRAGNKTEKTRGTDTTRH